MSGSTHDMSYKELYEREKRNNYDKEQRIKELELRERDLLMQVTEYGYADMQKQNTINAIREIVNKIYVDSKTHTLSSYVLSVNEQIKEVMDKFDK